MGRELLVIDERDVLRRAVAAAVLAPSAHNTQPWRFRIAHHKLEVYADHGRHLRVIDPERRQLLMSCGCALFNARVAVRAQGYTDIVTISIADEMHSDLVATLELGPRIVSAESDLASMRAIEARHTNRRPFLDRPVATETFAALEATAARHHVWMTRLLPEQKRALARLIDVADQLQFSDPAFRQELASWLAPFASRRRDGIPFAEKEYGSTLPFTVMRTIRSPEIGEQFGHAEEQLVMGAPIVTVLGTQSDDPTEWVACGQALEAVLLHATDLGLSAAFLNQVLERADARGRVGALIGQSHPQTVLRLGYAPDPVRRPAPRRPIDDVLLEL